MARRKKYPKQPRSKSVAAWERYEARVKAVDAYNKAVREAPKKINAIKDRVQKIKNKI